MKSNHLYLLITKTWKIFVISILCFTLIGSNLYSQTPAVDRLNNIIPPSPEVAEFQKYIDYPVNHATGIPDISIPLYQINTGSLSLPISLSYHASGFKVDEQSGVVGLGWVLNTGGMISRKIVNAPDEFSNYPYPYRNPWTLNQDIEADFFYIGNLHYEGPLYQIGSDAEYDVFYYDIGSASGKFFLTGNGANKRKPCVIPYEPISIKSNNPDFNTAIDYFEITDKSGKIYRFGKSSTDASTAIEVLDGGFTTAWFLKEIYSADRSSSIKFIYGSISRDQPHRTDIWEVKDLRRLDPSSCCESLNYSLVQRTLEQSTATYISPIISEIQFTGGSIQFIYLDNSWLKTVLIKNELGEIIKKIELQQDRFVNAPNDFLVKLSSLCSIDLINSNNENYTFSYNEQIPNTFICNTTGVDYWGYYNGKTSNSNLIPSFQLNRDFGGYYTTSSNNRDADEASMKIFILNKIKYPTGGTTEFEYETNKANNINVGGLRIKKIISKPSETDTPIIKKYEYGTMEDGNGILLQDPSNIHNYLTLSDYDCWDCIFPSLYSKFRVRTISSDFNDGGCLNSGNPVFYTEVAEYNENLAGEANGKSVYVYEPPVLYNFYLGTNTFNTLYEEWKTNHLKNKTDYIKNGTAYVHVKREDYGYYIRNDGSLKCTKVVIKKYGMTGAPSLWGMYSPAIQTFRDQSLWNLPNNEPYSVYWSPGEVYNIVEYEYKTGVKLLNNKTTTLYSSTGDIVTTESYIYGNDHNDPLAITTINSKGETQIAEYKYPRDFISVEPYTTMVSRNMISPVIEQIDKIGTTLLHSTKTDYSFWNNNAIIAPITVKTKLSSSNEETRLRFHSYDEKGNITSVSKENDVKASYLWSYNRSYPVVKGENVTSDILNTAVISAGATNLETFWSGFNDIATNIAQQTAWKNFNTTLRNNATLANAQVTTYTYKPLVGMTSQTDPNGVTTYYKYDSFGRLENVKDKDQNLLKYNKYHYQNQP